MGRRQNQSKKNAQVPAENPPAPHAPGSWTAQLEGCVRELTNIGQNVVGDLNELLE